MFTLETRFPDVAPNLASQGFKGKEYKVTFCLQNKQKVISHKASFYLQKQKQVFVKVVQNQAITNINP